MIPASVFSTLLRSYDNLRRDILIETHNLTDKFAQPAAMTTTFFTKAAVFATLFAASAGAQNAISNIEINSTVSAGSPTQVSFTGADTREYNVYLAAAIIGENGPTCKPHRLSPTLPNTNPPKRLPRNQHNPNLTPHPPCPALRRPRSRLLLHSHHPHGLPKPSLQPPIHLNQHDRRPLRLRKSPERRPLLVPRVAAV